MANFDSLPALQRRVSKMIEAHDSFTEGVLREILDNPNYTPTHNDIMNLLPRVDKARKEAFAAVKDSGFGDLDEKLGADARQMMEELDMAYAELTVAADIDTTWAELEDHEKTKLAHLVPVKRQKANLLFARINLDLKHQKADIPPLDLPPASDTGGKKK